MNTDNGRILAIDRGSHYIWLARSDDSWFIYPVWYIENDFESIIYISNIVWLHRISQIIIGKPKSPKIIEKIEKFARQIYISTEIQPEYVDENYSTVAAKAITGIYTKSTINDVVAAMEILKRKLWQSNL